MLHIYAEALDRLCVRLYMYQKLQIIGHIFVTDS